MLSIKLEFSCFADVNIIENNTLLREFQGTVGYSRNMAYCTVPYTEGEGQSLPNDTVLTVCVLGDIKQRRLGSGRELQVSLPL